MLPKNILYYGRHEIPPKPLPLRAGPLSLIFEPATGFLRHIRLGDREVVRAIYGAVRDQNWATVPPKLSGLMSEVAPDSFHLSFDVLCREGIADFLWHGLITGEASGRISYDFDGQARSRFLRNRIGLCVLHPIVECAGRACVIEHSDGRREPGTFPNLVSPHQPFLDIKRFSWEVADTGVTAELDFAGEVFETEDQRNWTDASYKTYSTPLSLPHPVPVDTGTSVDQSVTLSLTGLIQPAALEVRGGPLELSFDTASRLPLPPLGHCVASHGRPLSSREIERLQGLRPAHLRVDLELSAPGYASALEQAVMEARHLNAHLYVALILGGRPERELIGLAAELQRLQARVALWLVFHQEEAATTEKWGWLAKSILLERAPEALWSMGTRQNFAELNRGWHQGGMAFLPCFPLNPQAHMVDHMTLVENLAAQADAVNTAHRLGASPVLVSPITMRPPAKVAPSGDLECPPPALPSDVDPRQLALFGAGWTLGSISRLAATGQLHSLTYFETTGWRGLMETDAGSLHAEQFPSRPGWVFPIYHLFADLGEFWGEQVHLTRSSHPLALEGLALTDGHGRLRILAANLTGEVQEASVRVEAGRARVRYLDETNAEEAMRAPETFRGQPEKVVEAAGQRLKLKLLPFGLARIDVGG